MKNKRLLLAFSSVLFVLLMALFSIKQAEPLKPNSKIYECIEVGKDIELLKAHIKKEYDLVDQFVLLESLQENKEPLFAQFENEFKPYQDKITYIISSELLDVSEEMRDFHFKNQYLKALAECDDQDVVLFSKVGYIFEPKELYNVIVRLEKHPEEIIKMNPQFLMKFKSPCNLKATTFKQVKNTLPAGVVKSTKLKAQKSYLKSAFFPTLQP